MQGATGRMGEILRSDGRFNPRPLCRERPKLNFGTIYHLQFQSTPPMQGATIFISILFQIINVSIHAPYAGSDGHKPHRLRMVQSVSIHAPYAGSDVEQLTRMRATQIVSIHAPYAGSDGI